MIREFNFRLSRMQQVIGVDAVNHIDMVTGVTERVCQPVNVHRVTAEAVGWVKGRKVEEI